MNPWVAIGVAVAVMIISSILRSQRRQGPGAGAQLLDNADARPARRSPPPPPPLPRRRVVPPPLPRRRSVPPIETVTPAPQPSPPTPSPVLAGLPAVPELAKVTTRPNTPTAVQLIALLRNPQSLRAAVLLREVLDAPLSRRRALKRR